MEKELKELIENNKVIPFVGAGVSKAVKSHSGVDIFPDWKELLYQLTDGLNENDTQIIKNSLNRPHVDYLRVVDDIKEFYPTKSLYAQKLDEIFDITRESIQDDSLDLARAIWGLNQKLIITTNYDKILDWASDNPDNTQRWDIQSVAEQGLSISVELKKQTVWHLHGHIENKDNIILTTDSYERLYIDNEKYKTAFETLKVKLATKSFLFIGFSLDDEYFVNELEKISGAFGDYGVVHYVLLKEGKTLDKKFNQKIIPIYFEDKGQPLIDKINSLKPNIPKVHLDKIKELIKKLGGDEEEFLTAYFGEYYQEILKNEETYNNLTLKLQNSDRLESLIEEKKALEQKLNSYSLNPNTQSKIDKAFELLRFEEVREILDEYLQSTAHIQEDRYKAHYQKALSYEQEIKYKKAKDEMEFIPSQKIEDALMLNDYARIYYLCGEYDNALPLFLKALEIIERLLGEEHPDTARVYNNLASLYYSMGEYKKAEPLYLKSLEIKERLLGEEHPDTASSYNNLAGLYNSMGEYKKAEPLYLKALEIWKRLLGEEHPDTALSYNNLGLLYYSMGEYKKAEPLYLKSLEIDKRLLGEEHPSTARGYNNLAGLYNSMGEYKKAEPLLLKALEIWKRLLGEDHPDTATSYNNLAGLYNSMGEYKKAEPLYLKSLEIRERLLGEEHPDTATSYNNLAGLYDLMGEYKKAEPLYLKALEIKERLLGEEHPDTARGYNNLAGLYYNRGEFSKAYDYIVKAVEVWAKVLPYNHPHLIGSKKWLELITSKM
ncbi:MAG: tetratricopeptide repeat protein [Sulfurovum sp.]